MWFSWPYRWRLLASIFCAFTVAVLWSVNLSLLFPVLKILKEGKNLQTWVDEEITDHETARNKHAHEVDRFNKALNKLEDTPENEKERRRLSADLARATDAQDYHAAWTYRFQWLRAKVIQHLPPEPFRQFKWIIATVLIGIALKGLFEFLHESMVGRVTSRTIFDLRNAFFRRVVRQDVRQLQAAGTADLVSRTAIDTEQIGQGLKVLYGRVIAEPLKAAACFTAACIISWQLALLFAVVVPVALYVLTKVSKAMRKAARRALERISAMSKIMREALDGARAVKGCTREAHERRRFRTANAEFFNRAMRLINLDAFANPAIEVMVVFSVSLALSAGVFLVLTKSTTIWGVPMCSQPLSFETLMQFYVFLAAVADPVRKLSSVYAKLQAAEAASARVFEVYDREPTIRGNPSGPRLTGVARRIEFRHVCFSYNPTADQPTLDNVSFTVRAGETIAVVGGNGCGKTTLLALLPRFFDPDSGAVLIDGVNLRTAHLRSLRKLMGVVTQDTQLFDDTVFANIAYGRPGATREEVIEAAKKARAHEFIEKKSGGYDARMGDGGASFSGGEKQKIALARVILRDPKLLILDEFTSAIDTHSEADIHDAIKEFVKGRTTFIITHKLHTVPELADRVVMMEAGKVLDIGTHAELLARCLPYCRLFESGHRKMDGSGERPALPPDQARSVQSAPSVPEEEGAECSEADDGEVSTDVPPSDNRPPGPPEPKTAPKGPPTERRDAA
jgi:ATP-binding cassette subfamily B protein/subfamily B ATP-binding cassette protein MsbA